MDERISIRDSGKTLKKYGSTSCNNNFKKPETLVKHMVSSTDTLQGLALKYGVTTEQIRRTNRLWANDSLFLRESLMIPVPIERGDSLLTSPSDISLFDITESSQFLNQSNSSFSSNHSRSSSFRSDSGASGISSPCNGDSKENNSNNDVSEYDPDAYNEFLVRIDCDIANIRSQVVQAQDKSEFIPKDEDCIFLSKKKPAMSRRQQQQQQQHQHQNCITDLPTVVTQGSWVRTSLQKLQEKHDELFEL